MKKDILDKVKFTFKFNLVVAVVGLAVLGAGVVQDKARWGAAMAAEKPVQDGHIILPKVLDGNISTGLQNCLSNALNVEQKAHCNKLFMGGI